MNSFYTHAELNNIGLKKIGNNVLISRLAQFYFPENITIGNNVRIDDFCVLSGFVTLGNNIHLSLYCALHGSHGIELEDYTGLSARCTIYSAVDDFSGNFLIGPMVDKSLTNVSGGKVTIKKYSQIGASCIIMPNVTIDEGVAVGVMSFINESLESWGIYTGCPAKRLKDRSKNLLNLINYEG